MVHRPATIRQRRHLVLVVALVPLLLACEPPGRGTGTGGAGLPTGEYSTAAGTSVGYAAYPVPSGAIVVSTAGNDSAAGTEAAPYRTVARAISRAASGATIVIRNGSYHESLTIPSNKRLTIQSWPNEVVWLDGTQLVPGWTPDGGDWRVDGWTKEFDHSPTYERGAPDGTAESWTFLNTQYPMAAHPDQLWVSGSPQQQVSTRAQVAPGTFFHDEAANRLYLGTDPTGKLVRASALVRALRIESAGTVIRGIGVRGYAPSVPDIGALVIDHTANVTLEHVAVVGSATTGIAMAGAEGAILRNVFVSHSGMLGIQGQYADGARMERVLVTKNNSERFNQAPNAGGTKITKTRGFTVVDSSFVGNLATGLWFDASVSDMIITGSEMRDNSGHGTFLEISQKAVFANNIVTNNGRIGLQINNTADVKVWNNTFTGNGRSINLVQDDRRPGTDYGRDSRRPLNDPTMTWVNSGAWFHNNVLGNQRSTTSSNGNCLLCVEDYSSSGARTAAQMGVVSNGNIYNRPSASAPRWVVVWSQGAGNPAVYTTLAAFKAATGQEAAGVAVDGALVVSTTGEPTASMPGASSALPLPADISSLVGQPTGTRHLGAWDR